MLGHGGIGQPGGNRLVRAADPDAGLLEQQQNRLARQLAPAERAGQALWHVGRDVRQRTFTRTAHAHRFLNLGTDLNLQRFGDGLGGRNATHLKHLDKGF